MRQCLDRAGLVDHSELRTQLPSYDPSLLDYLARVTHLLRVEKVVVFVQRNKFVLIARGDHTRIQRTSPNEVKASVAAGNAEQYLVVRVDKRTGDVVESSPVEQRPASKHEEQIEQLSNTVSLTLH